MGYRLRMLMAAGWWWGTGGSIEAVVLIVHAGAAGSAWVEQADADAVLAGWKVSRQQQRVLVLNPVAGDYAEYVQDG